MTTRLGLTVVLAFAPMLLETARSRRFASLFAIEVLPLDEPWASRRYLIAARDVTQGEGAAARADAERALQQLWRA